MSTALSLGSCATVAEPLQDQSSPAETEVQLVEQDAALEDLLPEYKPELAEAFKVAWPTSFNRVELINSAQSKMHPFFEENLENECEHQLHIHFEEPDALQGDIEEIGEAIMNLFCSDLTDDVWVVIGEYEFLREMVSENSLVSDEFGGVCGVEEPPSIGCALYDTVWAQRLNVEDRKLRGLVAHEMFHIVQDSISPEPPGYRLPPGHPMRVPNWVTEGSAMFFEGSINDFLGTNIYADFAAGQTELRPGSTGTINLADLEEGFSAAVYNVGQFGTEYLVSNTSFDQFMEIWRLRDRGFEFKDAFQEAFGISLEDFYATTSGISIEK